jgi:murein L,D-transpeptidase YcbB/YkuD
VRPAHLLAVLVSGLLGVGLGVAGGVITGGSHHLEDPLGLDIPLVNQGCSDRSAVLVIATGSQVSAFSDVAAERPGSVHYLATAESCPTVWRQSGKEPRPYAAYLGPYSSVATACAERMIVAHRGDFVTTLRAGNTEPVQCLCHLSYTSYPVLRQGVGGTLEAMYVWALQDLLTHLGRNPKGHSTGHYDVQTVDEVKQYQQDNALPANGVVDQATWHSVVSRGCRRYPS